MKRDITNRMHASKIECMNVKTECMTIDGALRSAAVRCVVSLVWLIL